MLNLLLSLVFIFARAEPRRVILDTDFATDVDDAGALAVLHVLADRGEAEILAVVHDTSYPFSAAAIRAINAYYGRRPIGRFKGAFAAGEANAYVKVVADRFAPDELEKSVPDAVAVYRDALARQPDGAVTIISIGFLNNLDALLKSKKDGASPLDGRELVKRKVVRLVVMGGGFPARTKPEFNFSHLGLGPLTKRVIETWPTPILFSGFEIGIDLLTGGSFVKAPADHPVREAYRVFHGGEIKDRWSWDQTAVLAGVRGPQSEWTSSAEGTCVVHSDGSTAWRAGTGHHAYLVPRRPVDETRAMIEALMLQPPRRTR